MHADFAEPFCCSALQKVWAQESALQKASASESERFRKSALQKASAWENGRLAERVHENALRKVRLGKRA